LVPEGSLLGDGMGGELFMQPYPCICHKVDFIFKPLTNYEARGVSWVRHILGMRTILIRHTYQ